MSMPVVPDTEKYPLVTARHVPDVIALIAVLAIIYLFYRVDVDPLLSRYVYYADYFERAAYIVNPDYNNQFFRHPMEGHSPFLTLVARIGVMLFQPDLGTAVLFTHFCLVFPAGVFTYLLNRLYLSILASAAVTVFLFCGRIILPLATGLGMSSVLLLIPLSLAWIHALTRMTASGIDRGKRTLWTLVAGLLLGWIYMLGSHETVFALFCLACGVVLHILCWLRRTRLKEPIPVKQLAVFSAGLLVAFAVAVGGMAIVHCGIPESNRKLTFSDILLHRWLYRSGKSDLSKGSLQTFSQKMKVLAGTFVEGRYLTLLGRHHANTFLFPGKGFNGVIPLFVIPGFLVGLLVYFNCVKRLCSVSPRDGPDNNPYFLILLGTQLILFVFCALASEDPKPTRYTFAIYAVLVLSAWGFERAAEWCYDAPGKLTEHYPKLSRGVASVGSHIVIWCLVASLAAFSTLRLAKNYSDRKMYEKDLSHQILTSVLKPIVTDALTRAAEGQAVALYSPHAFCWSHPMTGLLFKFALPPNLKLIQTRQQLDQLADDTVVVRVENLPNKRKWDTPRSMWDDSVFN